jgi:GMP synthase (glutamine-hydrolysing)
MRTALVVRHARHEGLAGLRAPIEAAGYRIERIDANDPDFPDRNLLSPDLLILMGGPMGVYERARHPWMAGEIDRLAGRIAADRPTLGICLGAQMMAAALGADVYPGPVKEVGYGPVELTPAGRESPLRHMEGAPMLHWHGDTFDLPEGTELLASTALYRNQAFRRGRNMLALQYHAEMGGDPRFESWLGDVAYLALAGTTPEQVRRDHEAYGSAAREAGTAMLREWLGQLG